MPTSPLTIEQLEARIAPALLIGPRAIFPSSTVTFVSATTATYTDVDGDLVTVKFSKSILTAANVATVLVTSPIDPTHDQLQTIDLTVPGLAKPAAGTTITLTVAQKGAGDAFANVGYIKATGLDLGAVAIRGDLGAIDAGDAKTKTPGLKSLTVQSLGAQGTATGAPDLHSDIVGALSKLAVKASVNGATVDVTGGKDGKLGAVNIGVSLVGGSTTTARTGSLHSTGDMGLVKIGNHLTGGQGVESGALLSDGKIAGVTIGNSLSGGGANSAGTIHSHGNLGKVSIGLNLLGGAGDRAGSIVSDAKMADVRVGGLMQGGLVKIGGNDTPRTGSISSAGDMGKITVVGDLNGTFLTYSASIVSGGKIAAVTIGGSVGGGSVDHAGFIGSQGTIGSIKIGGYLAGAGGQYSGSISTVGDLPSVKIGSYVFGGSSTLSGVIQGKNLGTISIVGVLSGRTSFSAAITDSGAILATTISSLTVGGLQGGSTSNFNAARSGYISATTIKQLSILGDLSGGSVIGTGSLTDSGTVAAGHIDKMMVLGSVQAGSISSLSSNATNVRSGAIVVAHDLGALTIRGSVLGGEDEGKGAVPAVITAVGKAKPTKTADLAIGSLTIGGDVSLANIFAGYNSAGAPVNGGAQIGTVTVTGNWTASNLVAGAMNAASSNKFFGNGNDAAIVGGSPAAIAKITGVSIGGVVQGTSVGGDHFGFVARAISSFKIGGLKIPLAARPSSLDLGATSDVTIHQI